MDFMNRRSVLGRMSNPIAFATAPAPWQRHILILPFIISENGPDAAKHSVAVCDVTHHLYRDSTTIASPGFV